MQKKAYRTDFGAAILFISEISINFNDLVMLLILNHK